MENREKYEKVVIAVRGLQDLYSIYSQKKKGTLLYNLLLYNLNMHRYVFTYRERTKQNDFIRISV